MASALTCLGDFARERPGDYDLVANFCGVPTLRVQTWFKGEHFPHGVAMLKLRHFLMLVGYKVDELEELSPMAHSVAGIIAYGIQSPEEIQIHLEFRDISSVYNTLLRGNHVTAQRR